MEAPPGRAGERAGAEERPHPEPADLPFAPDLLAIDLSFISLAKVLGAVVGCSAARFDCLALVKPQFELGRGRVGKGAWSARPAIAAKRSWPLAPPRATGWG